MYAKRVKGTLLGLPPGSMPSAQQINSLELFALCAPQKDKSENDDEDEEGPQVEADIHHLWLPFLQGNKALGNCSPLQFKPPGDWPKVYTSEGLHAHFPMGVTAWKSCEPLSSLIIMVPHDSPPLEKDHLLDHLYSYAALKRYSWELENRGSSSPFVPPVGFDLKTRYHTTHMQGDTSTLNSSVRHVRSSTPASFPR